MHNELDLERAKVKTLEDGIEHCKCKITVAYRGLDRIISTCNAKARVAAQETKIRMKSLGEYPKR